MLAWLDTEGFTIERQFRLPSPARAVATGHVKGQKAVVIADSDGDYVASLAWGKQFESGNVLLTAGYRARGRLAVDDRDFARVPFESVFYGGWSGSASPGSYASPAGVAFRDNGCNELGSQVLSGTLKPVAA